MEFKSVISEKCTKSERVVNQQLLTTIVNRSLLNIYIYNIVIILFIYITYEHTHTHTHIRRKGGATMKVNRNIQACKILLNLHCSRSNIISLAIS